MSSRQPSKCHLLRNGMSIFSFTQQWCLTFVSVKVYIVQQRLHGYTISTRGVRKFHCIYMQLDWSILPLYKQTQKIGSTRVFFSYKVFAMKLGHLTDLKLIQLCRYKGHGARVYSLGGYNYSYQHNIEVQVWLYKLVPFCLLITTRCHFAYSCKMWPKQWDCTKKEV